MSHKKIMSKASTDLKADAKHYISEARKEKSPIKKKHEMIEKKEAEKGAKVMRKMAKKAHEY